MKTSWSFHGRTTPFASSCTKPSCVKSPWIHHGRAVSILRKWPVPLGISLISLMEYFFSLRNVEKGWKIYERVGELVRDRSMSPCQGYDARFARIVNEEVTKGRNRVEVFSSLWLLASLEIPPPPSSSSSSFFTRSNWTIRGILPIVAYDKCQMLIIFPERNSIYLWTDSKTEYNIYTLSFDDWSLDAYFFFLLNNKYNNNFKLNIINLCLSQNYLYQLWNVIRALTVFIKSYVTLDEVKKKKEALLKKSKVSIKCHINHVYI